jgi:hypothetical protein
MLTIKSWNKDLPTRISGVIIVMALGTVYIRKS